MVALILVMTSAPNGCCLLSIDETASGVPVLRSSRVATTVVVPRSNAMPSSRSVVSPACTSISTSSTITAVTLKSAARSRWPRLRSDSEVHPELQVVQRGQHALDVGLLVGQRRLGQLQVALLRRRPQDDLASDADGGRLRPRHQRRHLDLDVGFG